MNLKSLVKIKSSQPMKVGILMSGSGTNAEKIIEYQKKNPDCNFEVVLIFTDKPKSRAQEIGDQHGIPVEVLDIDKFYENNPQLKRYSLKDRVPYDKKVAKILSKYQINLLAYAGYMNITTEPIINQFLGLNIHPSDLSIKNEKGERKYVGDKVVRDAIIDGQKTISSTAHLITAGVDEGPIVMLSKPLLVEIPAGKTIEKDIDEISNFNQDRLKEAGDWIIFPKAIELIAQGKIKKDSKQALYYNKKSIPKGIKLK